MEAVQNLVYHLWHEYEYYLTRAGNDTYVHCTYYYILLYYIAPVLLSGTTLGITDSFKYLGITFEAGVKPKVSFTAKKIKFF